MPSALSTETAGLVLTVFEIGGILTPWAGAMPLNLRMSSLELWRTGDHIPVCRCGFYEPVPGSIGNDRRPLPPPPASCRSRCPNVTRTPMVASQKTSLIPSATRAECGMPASNTELNRSPPPARRKIHEEPAGDILPTVLCRWRPKFRRLERSATLVPVPWQPLLSRLIGVSAMRVRTSAALSADRCRKLGARNQRHYQCSTINTTIRSSKEP